MGTKKVKVTAIMLAAGENFLPLATVEDFSTLYAWIDGHQCWIQCKPQFGLSIKGHWLNRAAYEPDRRIHLGKFTIEVDLDYE